MPPRHRFIPENAKPWAGESVDEEARDRAHMVKTTIANRDISDPKVLRAMSRIPRRQFVLPGDRDQAYKDRALPIVNGQTISQPFIVAAMTQAAALKPSDQCLEVGTGSGYQAAVLSELCARVHTIEYLSDVAEFGKRNLIASGYLNRQIELHVGDGYAGWPKAAPFDAIVVTAAPTQVPKPLLEQLALGGRLVIPVGERQHIQILKRYTRETLGSDERAFKQERLFAVRFVPFLGGEDHQTGDR